MLALDKIEMLFNVLLEEGEVKVSQHRELSLKKYYTLGDRAWNHLFGTDKHHEEVITNIRVDWFVNGNHYIKEISPDCISFNLEETVNLFKKYAQQLNRQKNIEENFK